jgi:hypothetical protein
MKEIAMSMILMIAFLNGLAQTTLSKDDYIRKSDVQKKTGWTMLACGTTLIMIGAIIGGGDDSDEMGYGSNFEAGTLLVGIGLAADLASIPVFMGSAKNARKAATISFRNQRISFESQDGYAVRFNPVIALTVYLE